MLYMVTFAINIPQMSAYIPYMDPMGKVQPLLCRKTRDIRGSSEPDLPGPNRS